MAGTLVIIGHHKDEAFFGEMLRKLIEKESGIEFYHVEKRYHNCGRCLQSEVLAAQKEIYQAMQSARPDITIDIHTSEGYNLWWDAELLTIWEYEKLKKLKMASTEEFPVAEGLVFIPKNHPHIHNFMTLAQKEFPFVALENYLAEGNNNPPYNWQLQFAEEVVREISQLYRK